ncbi:hypothetical protein C8F01DRAFT_1091822 [Mycena amicta]|nr:hypothetical protein C8F01DRAFT_1091822 [Mycena amicta]
MLAFGLTAAGVLTLPLPVDCVAPVPIVCCEAFSAQPTQVLLPLQEGTNAGERHPALPNRAQDKPVMYGTSRSALVSIGPSEARPSASLAPAIGTGVPGARTRHVRRGPIPPESNGHARCTHPGCSAACMKQC